MIDFISTWNNLPFSNISSFELKNEMEKLKAKDEEAQSKRHNLKDSPLGVHIAEMGEHDEFSATSAIIQLTS